MSRYSEGFVEMWVEQRGRGQRKGSVHRATGQSLRGRAMQRVGLRPLE